MDVPRTSVVAAVAAGVLVGLVAAEVAPILAATAAVLLTSWAALSRTSGRRSPLGSRLIPAGGVGMLSAVGLYFLLALAHHL
ncbi:MAG: hypothetical protein ACYCTI_03580 [Acidimicrobiales bacterium]